MEAEITIMIACLRFLMGMAGAWEWHFQAHYTPTRDAGKGEQTNSNALLRINTCWLRLYRTKTFCIPTLLNNARTLCIMQQTASYAPPGTILTSWFTT
ncbi:unnamed protein product [Clavelina lepadiformis]|uniref:Secreted protein n=1 Tax=Clavelina lepadiformis TaxID=159417 RepID=A0ABP0FXG4_CLALP